jgi:predicted chitinase
MGRINYAVVGRWDEVSDDEATRIRERHEAQYRARLWSNPVVRLQHDTRTLEGLTERINEQTEGMRDEIQQRGRRSDETRALEQLRESYGP